MSVAVPSSKAVANGATDSPAAASSSAPATTDTLANVLPNLDRHLVLPLLDFLESRGTYSHTEVLKAKYDLLKPTNMVTFVLGIKREIDGTSEDAEVPEGASRTCFPVAAEWARALGRLNRLRWRIPGPVGPWGRDSAAALRTRHSFFSSRPAEFRKREQTVVATLNELQAQAQTVMDVISNPEVVAALRQDKLHNLAYLKDTHSVRSRLRLGSTARELTLL